MNRLLLILFLFPGSLLFSQSVTNSAGLGAVSPSSACLACPGSIWNNEGNITALDGIASDIDLENYGFCFQSTCFRSRSLQGRQFGFSIPASATILGIEANITRKAPVAGIIKDTIVELIQSITVTSPNYATIGFWSNSYVTQVYGGPTDLWGLTWTPAQINAPGTTISLQIANTDGSVVTGTLVDHMSMTVYYSTVTGIVESQTASPGSFSAYQNSDDQLSLAFSLDQPSPAQISVYNMNGKLVASKDLGTLSAGLHEENISVPGLENGIYLLQLYNGNDLLSQKILIR